MSLFLRTMIRRTLCLLAALAVIPPSSAFGWGNDGHMLVNRTAARNVPASMPPFLQRASARLAYLGPEPDRWRSTSEYSLKNSQEPDHYIDLERVEGMQLPEGRYEFYQKLAEKRASAGAQAEEFLPEHVGLQPYITAEVYGRLKVAFREYRRLRQEGKPTTAIQQNIILYAGWLGHYVADGANPLHTTINYDGWVSANPKGYVTGRGLHSYFETRLVSENLSKLVLTDLVKAPTRLAHPFEDYVGYLRESHRQVEPLYELEKTGAFQGEGTPEGVEFIRQQLGRGAQMLLNLWYTAWLESAQAVPRYRE